MSLIFNAECNYPLTFKHCFNILKEQISEFNFVFTKEGIQIQQQNNIKNTDIDIFLEASAFQNYEIKTEEPIIIGVNILKVFRTYYDAQAFLELNKRFYSNLSISTIRVE